MCIQQVSGCLTFFLSLPMFDLFIKTSSLLHKLLAVPQRFTQISRERVQFCELAKMYVYTYGKTFWRSVWLFRPKDRRPILKLTRVWKLAFCNGKYKDSTLKLLWMSTDALSNVFYCLNIKLLLLCTLNLYLELSWNNFISIRVLVVLSAVLL